MMTNERPETVTPDMMAISDQELNNLQMANSNAQGNFTQGAQH